LKILDHITLTPLLKTRLSEDIFAGSLPPVRGNFCQDRSIEDFAFGFVAKFLDAFDTDARQQLLLDVYGDTAQFSLTFGPTSSPDKLAPLRFADHNITKLSFPTLEYLKRGKVDILFFLKELPLSCHMRDSFMADVVLVPADDIQLLTLRLYGKVSFAFQKNGQFETPIDCNFHRTFVITPATNSWSLIILNDCLHIFEAGSEMRPVAAPEEVGVMEDITSQLARIAGVPLELASKYLASYPDPHVALEAINRDRAAATPGPMGFR